VLAARRAGVKKVVLPDRNRQDLEDIPDDVRQDVELVFVEDVRKAITEVLLARGKGGLTDGTVNGL